MTALVAHARIALTDPDAIIAPLCEHLAEHGAEITQEEGATIIALGSYRGWLQSNDGHLVMRAEAPDMASLQSAKQAIASHVIEFAPPGEAIPAIAWTGAGSGIAIPSSFRILTVTSVRDLSPHMRRISFRGEDLARFDSLEALHVRLFLPPPDLAEPEWPTFGEDGILRMPETEKAPAVRKYTIREIDTVAGTVVLDFVLHEDAGPGAAFAARARPGDRIGMAGPGGRGLREADWYLFMGDETALPAIGRMLAHLPPTARGIAFIEVADAGEEQALVCPAGVEIRWLHRQGAEAGTTALLQDAFDAVAWPSEEASIYLWAALEHAGFKALRVAARSRLRPERDHHLIVSYWRRGISEDRQAD